MFDLVSGPPLAQSSWHRKLSMTDSNTLSLKIQSILLPVSLDTKHLSIGDANSHKIPPSPFSCYFKPLSHHASLWLSEAIVVCGISHDMFIYLDVPYPLFLTMQLVKTQTWEIGWRVSHQHLDEYILCILSISTVPGLFLASWNCWLIRSYFLFIFGSLLSYFHALHSTDIQEICAD